jgi:hypothetical protein
VFEEIDLAAGLLRAYGASPEFERDAVEKIGLPVGVHFSPAKTNTRML